MPIQVVTRGALRNTDDDRIPGQSSPFAGAPAVMVVDRRSQVAS
jgi:hypothetical protein